jgi:hypothetical protein
MLRVLVYNVKFIPIIISQYIHDCARQKGELTFQVDVHPSHSHPDNYTVSKPAPRGMLIQNEKWRNTSSERNHSNSSQKLCYVLNRGAIPLSWLVAPTSMYKSICLPASHSGTLKINLQNMSAVASANC